MSVLGDRRSAALAAALGCDGSVLRVQAAGGGCINRAAIVQLGERRLFVKWNDHPLPRQFAAEAAGLSAMAEAGSGLVVPRPVAWDDGGPDRAFLALEYVDGGRRTSDFDERLGRGLAALHRRSSEHGFGFHLDGYCGATPQPNGWMPSWVAFYRERRLGHQARLARARGWSSSDLRPLECLIDRLDAWIADDEPPALIHGDLWSGNLMVAADGTPALVDPAAYFGHREAELGMMALFGGFSDGVFAAYHEAWPLRDGWRERLPLYSLYHVLNHDHLFGGSYRAQALRIAQQFVGS